jgi:hypothetical protein
MVHAYCLIGEETWGQMSEKMVHAYCYVFVKVSFLWKSPTIGHTLVYGSNSYGYINQLKPLDHHPLV